MVSFRWYTKSLGPFSSRYEGVFTDEVFHPKSPWTSGFLKIFNIRYIRLILYIFWNFSDMLKLKKLLAFYGVFITLDINWDFKSKCYWQGQWSYPYLAKLLHIDIIFFANVSSAAENNFDWGTTKGRPNIHCKNKNIQKHVWINFVFEMYQWQHRGLFNKAFWFLGLLSHSILIHIQLGMKFLTSAFVKSKHEQTDR